MQNGTRNPEELVTKLSPADRFQVPFGLAKPPSGGFLFNGIRLALEPFSYLGGGIGREKFLQQIHISFRPEALRRFLPLCGFFLFRFFLLSHLMLPFVK